MGIFSIYSNIFHTFDCTFNIALNNISTMAVFCNIIFRLFNCQNCTLINRIVVLHICILWHIKSQDNFGEGTK